MKVKDFKAGGGDMSPPDKADEVDPMAWCRPCLGTPFDPYEIFLMTIMLFFASPFIFGFALVLMDVGAWVLEQVR